MAINDEGALISGAYSLGHYPTAYMKYDMDRLGKLTVISRGTAKFMHYLMHQQGLTKSTRVNTFEPRVHDINELPRSISVYEDSSTTLAANTKLKVLNKYGRATTKQNDFLVCKDLFYEVNNAIPYSTSFGLQGGLYYASNEVMFVTGVDPDDAAGAGYTYIYVRRGWTSTYSYPSVTAATLSAAPSSPPAILTTYTLFKAGNAFAHGTGAPTGDFVNPQIDGNYLQELKWALEYVKEMMLEQTWLNDSGYTPMSLQQQLKVKQIAWDHERMFLFGKKTKSTSGGNPLYTSGGLTEYIKKDADHILDYSRGGAVSTVNYIDINKSLNEVMKLGGGEAKTGFTGYDLLTRFSNAFFNKHMFLNEEQANGFNIPVYKLVGTSGEINLVGTYGMQEAGWGDKLLLLDFSTPQVFERTTFQGQYTSGTKTIMGDFDMFREDNIQLPGEQIQKSQYISITGLQRRAQQYHAIMYGFPETVAKESIETAG